MFVVNLKYLPLWLTGIIEVSLNRPGARNAIGTEILRGLKHTFETISEDSSANVVMISSSVPKVFCAGADLKVSVALFMYYYNFNHWDFTGLFLYFKCDAKRT